MLRAIIKPPLSVPLRRLYSSAAQASARESIISRKVVDPKILKFAQAKAQPIKLHDLVKYRNSPGRQPPLPDLLDNAKYLISELTERMAKRLDHLRTLPLIVVLNPHISEVYAKYYNSFAVVSTLEPPKTAEENEEFVGVLGKMMAEHEDVVPILSMGLAQTRETLGLDRINQFLWDHLQARIGSRLITQHHIQLTNPVGPNFVGCIQTDLSPGKMCEKVVETINGLTHIQFGFTPFIKIDMGYEVEIAYPPEHLEYMLTELLKNAFMAHCSSGEQVADMSPITVTVIKSGQGVIVRLRDRGGGIQPENEEDVFKFAYTTVDREGEGLVEGVDSSLGGLGFGLPLSKAYAEFFGGSLQLQSYHGWGTDVYLTLRSPMVQGFYRDVDC